MATVLSGRPETPDFTAGGERQIVALHLGDEIYGVDIAFIHSVLTLQPITVVPNVPHFVKGVMNLRGKILPVLDLRARFGMAELDSESYRKSRIVIVEAEGFTAGLIVDAVSEVLKLSNESIEPPSALLGSPDLKCLIGIGRVKSRNGNPRNESADDTLVLLLNIVETLSAVALASDFKEL